jgi:hypothetical protein
MPPRAEASRINGSKSHGPKTEEGRRAVSLNALKHGLTAETVVLANESEEQYEAELQAYLDHFAPANKPEADLVRQLASVHWRLVRFTAIETSLLEIEMKKRGEYVGAAWKNVDERSRLALAFESLSASNSSLALLNRYEARLHHEYQRLLKSLVQLQATRRAAQAKFQNEPERPSSEPTRPSAEPSEPPVQGIGEMETETPGTSNGPPVPVPPTTAILAYWKAQSSNGSRPMATSRSFRSSSWASSDFPCQTSSCSPAAASWSIKAICG